MRKLILIFVLTILLTPAIHAQLRGIYLVDSVSKIPVAFAAVHDSKMLFTQASNENGFVNLSKLPKWVERLQINCIGYQTKWVHVSELSLQKSIPIISLAPKVSSLSEVTIQGGFSNIVFKNVSELDIHYRPIGNSQEVLRMVPGLFIGQHAGGGKAEQIFLRGFDLDHGTDIHITVDGLPVNMVSHAHGQGYADLHFVIPELIERVNFNKGPYFADKGNFTTAGFVEFKTKDYLDRSFVKLEGGQFGTYRGIAGINLLNTKEAKRNQSLYLAGEGSFTKGYFDSPQNFKRYNAVLKYHGLLNRNHSLSASITGFTSKWNASGQIPDRAVAQGEIGFFGAIDDKEGGQTARYNANVELNSHLPNDAIIKNHFYYTKNFFELYSNFTFYLHDSINGDQIRQKEARDILGYNGVYIKEFLIGSLKNEMRAGLQVRYDYINNIELTRTKDRSIVTLPMMYGDVNELNTGLYYSQRMLFSPKLDVQLGLRYDFFNNKYHDEILQTSLSSQSNILLPKLDINYRINANTQLYWYSGKGYHSNDSRVAVQQNGQNVLPPAYGSDLGAVFKLGEKLYVQSSVWYLWLDQEFIYVGDEGIVESGGKTRRLGYDLSARIEVAKNLLLDCDLNLSNPRALEVSKSESYLPLAPIFTSQGGITYKNKLGWNGSLRYRYLSDRPADETNTVIAKGYFIVDVLINYTHQKWETGISVQNVLNTRWKETQFNTESRLKKETNSVTEIHFTPGTPFFAKMFIQFFF